MKKITFEYGSELESIGNNFIYQNRNFKFIEIPATVTQIGTSSNYTLEEIYFGGTESDSLNVSGLSKLALSGTAIYYYSETEPETEGNFWHYENGEITKWQIVG